MNFSNGFVIINKKEDTREKVVKMQYTKIDIETWDRKELFRLYTGKLKIRMELTVDMDVTKLLQFTKKQGLRFYPTMIWAVSKMINSREEFKYAYDENGDLIRWEFVSPSYTDFNPETEKFVKFITEYTDDFSAFYNRVVEDCKKHKNESGFLPNQPKNNFDISCLPWVRYNNLSLAIESEEKSLFPIVIWGKYQEENGKMLMPVTTSVHHAVSDGFHLSRFFNELQTLIDNIEQAIVGACPQTMGKD